MTEEDTEVVKFSVDEPTCFLSGKNKTTIHASEGSHVEGSSKLKLKNFVNFNWDVNYYRGQLIAVHINETVIAYGFAKPETSEGLVRVVKRDTNERVLIKEFNGLIEDIGFAHLYAILMLACIDQSGSVKVFVIREERYPSQKLKVFPVFQISGDPSYCFKNKYLISWCQYVPEEDCLKELEYQKTYKGKMLAVVRGPEVEIWHIGIASTFTAGPVFENRNLNKTTDVKLLNDILSTVIKIDLKDSEIISISFSPDGTTIALALYNGSVYFYQISFDNAEDSPKCVFNWNPEEVFLSLRSMVFLDNRKDFHHGVVELWKYVVTLSNHNEIILWSCETWQSLQKITFVRPFIAMNPMKLAVDGTGKYLLLSDIDNNLLYALELSVDINSSKKNIRIVSVSEILLKSPMLNIIIVNAKVDHNDMNLVEQINSSGDKISNQVSNTSTTINLFAIQPKSIQEGQLIVLSPDTINVEPQPLIEINKIDPPKSKAFPKPPSLDDLMEPIEFTKNNSNAHGLTTFDEKKIVMHELSSIEVHNLVKEKLRLKGINMNQSNAKSLKNAKKLQNKSTNSYTTTEETPMEPLNSLSNNQQTSADPLTNFINSLNISSEPMNNLINNKQTPDEPLIHIQQSPVSITPNNLINSQEEKVGFPYEVKTIISQLPEQESQYNFQPLETNNDTFESVSNYSTEKEETNCYSGESVFNGSTMPTVKRDVNNLEAINNGVASKIDDIYTCLQEINNQLKFLTKKQKKIENQLNTVMSMNTAHKQITSELIRNLESTLKNVVETTNNAIQKNIQVIIDHKLNSSQKKIAEIVKNSISNKIDIDLFTRSLVASLSPTLDNILKDLFMSTVIPKFEQACCSMFKQIDDSFTERSLEYQNELKLLLNGEGTINYKLEHAFEKFKMDMNNVVVQISNLLSDKPMSQTASVTNDSEFSIANITDLLDRGEVACAFTKALSATNLDLVLFVCEKVPPEELFQPPISIKTPIILSLIQQLSVDLSNNTELKHRYLDAAVGSLDYTNDHHKDLINFVLIKVDSNMVAFMQQNPYHHYVRKLKMLQLAIKTIISYNNHLSNN